MSERELAVEGIYHYLVFDARAGHGCGDTLKVTELRNVIVALRGN